MAAEKNSLVANINRRKRAGKSRPKTRSTISRSAYEDMQAGWPGRKTKSKGKKKSKKKNAKRTTKRAKRPQRRASTGRG